MRTDVQVSTKGLRQSAVLVSFHHFDDLVAWVHQSGGGTGMDQKTLAVLVTVGFSLVGVLGDYFLKRASGTAEPLKSVTFYVGLVIYASTAFGWVFVMRHQKLATISVVYSVSMIVLLTAMGVLLFRESLNGYEIVGLLLAIASLILLARFG
jgi:drug/metabolite transporter (DMT)-like permease